MPDCLNSACVRPAAVVLVLRPGRSARERAYCEPCAAERRVFFAADIVGERPA